MEILVGTLAAMLGAGFASGREVWVFFAAHGIVAAPLGLLASLLFAAAAWQTALRAGRSRDPLGTLFGRYRALGQAALSLFSLVTFAAVLAVLGSLAGAAWHMPPWQASLLAAILAAGLGASGMKRQRAAQGILLVAVLACVGAASVLALARPASALPAAPVGLRGLLGVFGFVAYNIALATDGIARSAGPSARRSAAGAAAGGLIAGLLLTLEATALARHGALIAGADLPLVGVAASVHGLLGDVVAGTVLLAGLSAASSFAVASGALVGGPWVAAAAAFALSLLGVRTVIDQGYPIMAAVAGAWLVLLFLRPPSAVVSLHRRGGRSRT